VIKYRPLVFVTGPWLSEAGRRTLNVSLPLRAERKTILEAVKRCDAADLRSVNDEIERIILREARRWRAAAFESNPRIGRRRGLDATHDNGDPLSNLAITEQSS